MDDSEYGLGAALIQSCHPIAFASKTHKHWDSQTLRESISQYAFGLKKFHTYIYGRHVTVENDHKLPEMIQYKPIHVAPPQLQWMLLHMQKYDYTIWYKPGKDMVLANHLSHFPSHINSLPIPIAHNVQHVQLSNTGLNITWGSVEHDPVYSTVYCLSLEIGPTKDRKFYALPYISGVPGINCPPILAYSSRGQASAFPWNSSTTPLLICMEHIRESTGCRPRQERQCISPA